MGNIVKWKGYRLADRQDFPFDRHVIRLQNLDFVWRSYKDDDDFFDSMKIAPCSEGADGVTKLLLILGSII